MLTATNLTPDQDFDVGGPAWSTDASKIAYFSHIHEDGIDVGDIWVMDSDGSHKTQLTDDPYYQAHPAWSPDGTTIAYTNGSWPDSHIWVMDADGTNKKQLTFGIPRDSGPCWSPDGKYIAFHRLEAPYPEHCPSNVWVMKADGTEPTQLTDWAVDGIDGASPDWHPAGTKILFVSGGMDSLNLDWDIWEMELLRVEPDFEISVYPSTLILHVGGWNDSASLTIISIGGFSGWIDLSFTGPSEAKITIDFAQNSVYLPENSQLSVMMNVSSVLAPLSTYFFTIIGKGSLVEHETTLEINLVGNSFAITTIVCLDEISKMDPPFSIQQNFKIATPDGTWIYWAQNIIQVGRDSRGRRQVFSIFQVFDASNLKCPVLNTFLSGLLAPRWVSFPVVLNLTSHIDGNTLFLENNASSLFLNRIPVNVAWMELPEGSYIVGYPGKIYYHRHDCPEIVLVGLPWLPYLKDATFKYPTRGKVTCYVKLCQELSWRSTQNIVLELKEESQTAEKSSNLDWLSDGSFHYFEGSTDQGISFIPDYSGS